MTALGLHGDTVHPAGNLVFGRVFGILAAYTWKRWRTPINRGGPLGGGVAFLAFLGMGGERTANRLRKARRGSFKTRATPLTAPVVTAAATAATEPASPG
ncbi:MAG: hypothetical protein O7B24_11560 [Alphaproteobacteria bacterium]|nr:hypothetical protein [Alphaproteobacteria bacterium]